jgi:putative long chain acyl-CoA synthase
VRGSHARPAGALSTLPVGARPDVVRVVERIPVTTWYRPAVAELREQGLPDPANAAQPAWYLDAGGERYRPLTAAARRRLSAAGE